VIALDTALALIIAVVIRRDSFASVVVSAVPEGDLGSVPDMRGRFCFFVLSPHSDFFRLQLSVLLEETRFAHVGSVKCLTDLTLEIVEEGGLKRVKIFTRVEEKVFVVRLVGGFAI
jgi:hypothetical protein